MVISGRISSYDDLSEQQPLARSPFIIVVIILRKKKKEIVLLVGSFNIIPMDAVRMQDYATSKMPLRAMTD